MKYEQKIVLKNGKEALIRNGDGADGAAVFENFNRTHAETDYLLSYPDKNSYDPEREARLLEEKKNSPGIKRRFVRRRTGRRRTTRSHKPLYTVQGTTPPPYRRIGPVRGLCHTFLSSAFARSIARAARQLIRSCRRPPNRGGL